MRTFEVEACGTCKGVLVGKKCERACVSQLSFHARGVVSVLVGLVRICSWQTMLLKNMLLCSIVCALLFWLAFLIMFVLSLAILLSLKNNFVGSRNLLQGSGRPRVGRDQRLGRVGEATGWGGQGVWFKKVPRPRGFDHNIPGTPNVKVILNPNPQGTPKMTAKSNAENGTIGSPKPDPLTFTTSTALHLPTPQLRTLLYQPLRG